MATDPVRDAARAILDDLDADGTRVVREAHLAALRAALASPTSGPAAPANDAAAMRHECAEIARRGAVVAYEQMADPRNGRRMAHTYADCMEAVGKALDECESMIRALPLPPAPVDAVERARREFYEAATAVYAFDSEVDGRHEGRHDPRFRKLDDAAVDAYGEWQDTIAAEASAGRDGKGE